MKKKNQLMTNMVMLLLTQIQVLSVVELILNKMVHLILLIPKVGKILVVPILISVVFPTLLIFLNNFLVVAAFVKVNND
ncbi:hypothetical protein SDC9_174372 [bioreactor metagenome]|uniref:Uncharacterized protein n=1 Tax=bioreactor metagenome TaxID=1076179 RepID=A0A645GL51_9ZZZZ